MAFRSAAAAAPSSRTARIALSAATLLAGGVAAHQLTLSRGPVHAEAALGEPAVSDAGGSARKRRSGTGGASTSASAQVLEGAKWSAYVWGSNRSGVLAPLAAAGPGPIKSPRPLSYTGSSPLRDLVLAETYGAAVDARGDVWMWGAGYDEAGEGAGAAAAAGASLRGKNITKLSPTPFKVYALSRAGRVYTLAASRSAQAAVPEGAAQRGYPWWTLGMGSWLWTDPGVDVVEVHTEDRLGKGERFVDISTGRDHVLALTNHGRTYSMPATPLGNSHFQLGTRRLPPSTKDTPRPDLTDPAFRAIRAFSVLHPITSLAGVPVAQVSAGERSSFVRTRGEGRVLGFGANEYGQIGLGANVAVDVVPTPTEVVLARGYRGGTTVRCLNVAAGANNTFFTVEREGMGPEAGKRYVDLLASGSGVTGTLGHGLWSSVSGAPVKVKTVSGLQEYSDELKSFIPINVVHMAISPSQTPHAIATLHTVALSDPVGVQEGQYGNDVMVWGAGGDYQLGNGRRSNLAVPQHLQPLSGPGRDTPDSLAARNEKIIDSGTISPMPHKRLQLHEARADAYDPEGKLIKRNVRCTETMVAGWNTSAVYWKINE